MISEVDKQWMQHALALAQHGLYTTRSNPRVGCVIVADDKIIGQGWHAVFGGEHAEMQALREAGAKARGATCYVTLAPCTHHGKTPPCTDALIQAGIRRVVAATKDPNPLVAENTANILTQAGIEWEVGVCEAQARALNPGFFMRMENGRPFVRLKVGMSLDGKTGLPSGESQWITCPESRERVQKIRAQSGAVVTGIGTILYDDPQLNVRDNTITELSGFVQPLRVVLDSNLRFPLNARMLELPGKIIIFAAQAEPEKILALKSKDVDVYLCPDPLGQVDLHVMLEKLAMLEINDIMIEAGAILNGAFINAELVDECHAFIAPYLIGDPARGMCALGLTQLKDKLPIHVLHQETVGVDQYVVFKIK